MNNCFIYVIRKMISEGGYFIYRRSKLAEEYNLNYKWNPMRYMPHFLHMSKDGKITQYTVSDDAIVNKTRSDHVMNFIGGSIVGGGFVVLSVFLIMIGLIGSLFYNYKGEVQEENFTDK